MNSKPFDFFDRVYCIHLPHEKERKKKIQKQFESVGITDVTYIHTAPPSKGFSMSNMRRNPAGELGVNLSQIKAVVQAISDGAERPLFFEDDIVFDKAKLPILQAAIDELPEDWSVFYMGGHPRGPNLAHKVSPNLVKIVRYSFADAYCINGSYLNKFFGDWCTRISAKNAMYDFILGEFAGATGGYAMYPIICEQYAGISAVTNQFDDKKQIIARAWASHLGPSEITPEHNKIFQTWKSKNMGRWKAIQKKQNLRRIESGK